MHLGRRRRLSPAAKSERQIAHSASSPGRFRSEEKLTVGKVFSAFFFTPVFAAADWADLESDPDSDEEPEAETKVEQRNAQRMMELSPREQIKAQRRTDRTITTFASKLLSPGYCSDEEEEEWPAAATGDGGAAVVSGEWRRSLLE